MRYVILDVWPSMGSEAFSECVGAIVGCWLNSHFIKAQGGAPADIAAAQVSAAGWQVARVLSDEPAVHDASNVADSSLPFFLQAQSDGFVAHFRVVGRETVGEISPESLDIAAAFASFSASLAERGGYTLFLEEHGCFATGLTPDGNPFLPLWDGRLAAQSWWATWPGAVPRHISAEALRGPLLEEICGTEMWVAAALTPKTLTTFHASQVAHQVTTARDDPDRS